MSKHFRRSATFTDRQKRYLKAEAARLSIRAADAKRRALDQVINAIEQRRETLAK